jgi:hypothetical protein
MRIWLTVLIPVSLALAADPFVGRWKPDVAKWTLSPGAPPSRAKETITIESAGKNRYRTSYTVEEGTERELDVWHLDGKEHTQVLANGTSVTAKAERVSNDRIRMTIKGPKGTANTEWSVSTDGKTLTLTRKGAASTSGRELDETLIYTRQ